VHRNFRGALEQSEPIGGPGCIVEIESKFGKRKFNHGKRVDGVWVFGGIEQDSHPMCCSFFTVNDRIDLPTHSLPLSSVGFYLGLQFTQTAGVLPQRSSQKDTYTLQSITVSSSNLRLAHIRTTLKAVRMRLRGLCLVLPHGRIFTNLISRTTAFAGSFSTAPVTNSCSS